MMRSSRFHLLAFLLASLFSAGFGFEFTLNLFPPDRFSVFLRRVSISY